MTNTKRKYIYVTITEQDFKTYDFKEYPFESFSAIIQRDLVGAAFSIPEKLGIKILNRKLVAGRYRVYYEQA